MAEQEFVYRIEDGIGRFTFNRPRARNALTYAMYDGLKNVCTGVPSDGSVRALVVEGSGGSFAAGTDMALFRGFRTAEDAWGYEARMEAVFRAIERCPVPTIAAIDGACTGGGAAIAAACDLRLATARLKFGVPIARTLGNCLSAANLRRLSRLLGPERIRDVLLTARLVEADEALAIGLVREVVADAETLAARTSALAQQLAAHAPLTLRALKEGLRRLEEADDGVHDRDLVAMCYTSADFQEGIDAFLAKRKPVWRGV